MIKPCYRELRLNIYRVSLLFLWELSSKKTSDSIKEQTNVYLSKYSNTSATKTNVREEFRFSWNVTHRRIPHFPAVQEERDGNGFFNRIGSYEVHLTGHKIATVCHGIWKKKKLVIEVVMN